MEIIACCFATDWYEGREKLVWHRIVRRPAARRQAAVPENMEEGMSE